MNEKQTIAEKFPYIETALIFAARYTHHRATAGTFTITECLEYIWDELRPETKKQIMRESNEATENTSEWASFRKKMTITT